MIDVWKQNDMTGRLNGCDLQPNEHLTTLH